MNETISYVICNSHGNYADYCARAGYGGADKFYVVEFLAWSKWYNEQRFTNTFIKPPPPVFIGDNYEAVFKVMTTLNNQLTKEGK